MNDLVTGSDGLLRPAWAEANELQRDYYDHEWGNPVTSESGVFERLALEGFQSGLSWAVVLRKRPRFREVFCDFDPDAVAAFGDNDLTRLLDDAGIVRNRQKIEACINNATRTVDLRGDGGLSRLVWSYAPEVQPAPASMGDIGVRPESEALAKRLKKLGFRFVGPTTMQALLEAIGVLNHHVVGSHRRPGADSASAELTPAQVAEVLGVSVATVRKRIADGSLAAHTVGSRHRVTPSCLGRYIRDQDDDATPGQIATSAQALEIGG